VKACSLEPDSVRDRSSGVSVPADELRLDSDTRDADEDGSSRSRSRSLLLRLPLVR
jgi:hypothetical protein